METIDICVLILHILDWVLRHYWHELILFFVRIMVWEHFYGWSPVSHLACYVGLYALKWLLEQIFIILILSLINCTKIFKIPTSWTIPSSLTHLLHASLTTLTQVSIWFHPESLDSRLFHIHLRITCTLWATLPICWGDFLCYKHVLTLYGLILTLIPSLRDFWWCILTSFSLCFDAFLESVLMCFHCVWCFMVLFNVFFYVV